MLVSLLSVQRLEMEVILVFVLVKMRLASGSRYRAIALITMFLAVTRLASLLRSVHLHRHRVLITLDRKLGVMLRLGVRLIWVVVQLLIIQTRPLAKQILAVATLAILFAAAVITLDRAQDLILVLMVYVVGVTIREIALEIGLAILRRATVRHCVQIYQRHCARLSHHAQWCKVH
jgi:hypothetical protein